MSRCVVAQRKRRPDGVLRNRRFDTHLPGVWYPTVEQREPVFAAVRADARIPNGALVLLDVREVDVGMSKHVVVERLRVLLDQLGPKLGPARALIVTAGVGDQARIFQTEAIGFGLRVELFSDERAARQWLNALR